MKDARRSSSLPSGVFKAAMPDVEAAIAGGVADLLLKQMATTIVTAQSDHEPPPPADQRQNRVSADEIATFLAGVRETSTPPRPELTAHLEAERTWVLIDLASNARGTARAAATQELREFVDELHALPEEQLGVLQDLVARIQAAKVRGASGVSMLMHVLMLAAGNALRKANAR